jgi:hypothetical protein
MFLTAAKFFEMWWPGTESNRRRQPFQGCALPAELPGQGKLQFISRGSRFANHRTDRRQRAVVTDHSQFAQLSPACIAMNNFPGKLFPRRNLELGKIRKPNPESMHLISRLNTVIHVLLTAPVGLLHGPTGRESGQMPNAQVELSGVLSPLNCVKRERRLASLVSILARELARLDEDNMQLRAAVSVYRDMLRSMTPRGGK